MMQTWKKKSVYIYILNLKYKKEPMSLSWLPAINIKHPTFSF